MDAEEMLHLLNIYVYDVSYPDKVDSNAKLFGSLQEVITQIGRAPWILGADFNQEPTEALVSWLAKARVAATDVPTHVYGRVLDGLLPSIGLGRSRAYYSCA